MPIISAETRRRTLLRAALQLHECYQRQRLAAHRGRIESLRTALGRYLDHACEQERLLARAIEKRMPGAAEVLSRRYDQAIRDLHRIIDGIQHRRVNLEAPVVPSQRELYLELLAAEDEFGHVEVDLEEGRISVTTDPIVLEGVALGPFRIDLMFGGLGERCSRAWYTICALEPSTPPCNDDVTHPHVEGGRLCAGDGVDPIELTLRSGRLSELFLLIRSVLENYNPNSPYVEIEKWEGVSCFDCGYLNDADSMIYCGGCQRDFCEECTDECRECREVLCRGCLLRSEISKSRVCEPCSARCSECGALAGKSELTEGVCSFCQEQLEPSDQVEEQHHAPGISDIVQEEPASAEPSATIAPPTTQAA